MGTLGSGSCAAATKAKYEVYHFLRGLVFSLKDSMRKHIARARNPFKERRSTVVEILRSVENDLHDIVSGQSDLENSPFDVICVMRFLDVLKNPWVDIEPYGFHSSLAAVVEIQPPSSSGLKKNSKTPPKV